MTVLLGGQNKSNIQKDIKKGNVIYYKIKDDNKSKKEKTKDIYQLILKRRRFRVIRQRGNDREGHSKS